MFITALKTASPGEVVNLEIEGGATATATVEELRAALLDVEVIANDMALPRLCSWCGPAIAGADLPASLAANISARRRA